MRLLRLLFRGDPEGTAETEEVVAEAREQGTRLRTHVQENHLSEALAALFAPNPPNRRLRGHHQ
jgi:hypothetical protein